MEPTAPLEGDRHDPPGATAAGSPDTEACPAQEPGSEGVGQLSALQRRQQQQKLVKQAQAKADSQSRPVRTFKRAGKQVCVFDKHRLLEGLPSGWILEQVARHGKGASLRTCDNYWIEPDSEGKEGRRFDSMRKVRAYLDPESEEAAIIAARQQEALAWRGTLAVADEDVHIDEPAKRQRLLGEGDDVEAVLDAIVRYVERLHSHRPPGRSTRHGPPTESTARRAEMVIAEGPSAFLVFGLAYRNELGEAQPKGEELAPQQQARMLASKWRLATPATRAAFEELAARERSQIAQGLKSKGAERAQKLEAARRRLLSLLPEDADCHSMYE